MSIKNSIKIQIVVLSANGYAPKAFFICSLPFCSNLGWFQPFRESGVCEARLCSRTSLGKLLGVPCVLVSFAVGDSGETEINCRIETVGTFRLLLARGQVVMDCT